MSVSGPPVRPAIMGAALLAVASLGVIANAAVAPALPGLRDAFQDTAHINTLAGLVITLPSLGIILTAALAGWLADRIGRRKVMLASLLLYGAAGVSGLFAQTLWQVLAGRFLLGIAIGGTMTSSLAMIADCFTGEARTRFMSTQAVVMSGAAMVFLIIGGFLGELGWRYPFLVYAAGFLLLPVALALLSETQPTVLAADADARLDLRPLLLVGVTALLSMIFYYLMPTRLPFHLKELGIASPATAGLTIAAGTLSMATMAFFYARTAARMHPLLVYACIFASVVVGYALIGSATSLWQVVLGATFSGAGNGWLFPANNLLIMKRAPAHMRGRASGFHTTCIFSGQFLSPVIAGPIADRISDGRMFLVFAAAAAVVTLLFVAAWLRAKPVSEIAVSR